MEKNQFYSENAPKHAIPAISCKTPSPKLHKILILFILLIKKLRPSLLLYNNKYSKASRALFTEMIIRDYDLKPYNSIVPSTCEVI